MMPSVKHLGELCCDVVLNNTRALQDSKRVEEVVGVIARREALNTSILQLIDNKAWIKCLDLKASNITDDGLERICGISWLTVLNLSECVHVSDEGLLKLKAHKHLCSIDISKTKVSDVGVQGLASCVNIEVLDISYTQIGDGSIVKFGGHTKLQSLIARNTRVSDKPFITWQTTKNYPVALHTLVIPFTKITDSSAKAISGILSLSLLDVKSTKYSMNGLALIQGAWRQRHKGKNVKLHPGNKLEVISCTRTAPTTVETPFVWLHDAVCDYALFKGAYVQRQKRTTSYTSSLSVIGAFSNMNLASSQAISQTPSDSCVSATPTTAPENTDPFATPINTSEPFILPSLFSELVSEANSANVSASPCISTSVLSDLPISISLDSVFPTNAPASSSPVATVLVTSASVDISTFTSAVKSTVDAVAEQLSMHYDFPSYDEEAISISPEITPKQTPKQLEQVLHKLEPAPPKNRPTSKSNPKPLGIRQEALTVRRSARTVNSHPLAVKPADAKTSKPNQTQTSKPKLPRKTHLSEDKENQHPQDDSTVLDGRKSGIHKNKRAKIQTKVEATPEPLPPKKNKRKAPSTVTPAKSKRTRRATPATVPPTLTPPTSQSAYHTRSSRGHHLITVPLEALPKKQKKKAPSPPTPKGPTSLPAEIPDSPQPRSPFIPASTDTISDQISDISHANTNDVSCDADVSDIAKDSTDNSTDSSNTTHPFPLDSSAFDSGAHITTNAELPTSPIAAPFQHDTNSSCLASPINLSDSSILPATSSTCDSDIATDSNQISPPYQETDDSLVFLSDSEPSSPSSCTSPTQPCTPPTPIFEGPTKTSSPSSSSVPKRSLPKPSLTGFQSYTSQHSLSPNRQVTPPRPLRLSFDFSNSRSSPFTSTPTRKRSLPSPSGSTPKKTRSAPTTPNKPRTPTTPSNYNPAKVLSPAERVRNNQLNSEFLRMRKLLLY